MSQTTSPKSNNQFHFIEYNFIAAHAKRPLHFRNREFKMKKKMKKKMENAVVRAEIYANELARVWGAEPKIVDGPIEWTELDDTL